MDTTDILDSPAAIDRRSFILASAGAVAALAVGGWYRTAQAASPYSLPPLPYADSALEPVITANTIGFHYGKHHLAYGNNTKKMVEGTEWADADLEAIGKASFGKPDKKALRALYAQLRA